MNILESKTSPQLVEIKKKYSLIDKLKEEIL